MRAVAKQEVAALALRRVDWPGYDADVAIQIERVPGSDQRSAFYRCFDDDRQPSQCCDEPISLWEGSAVGVRARWELRKQQAGRRDSAMQRAMRRRICDIDTGSENGDGPSASVERRDMRNAVDTSRHSAHHGSARSRQRAGDLSRDALAVQGCLTSPDDRDDRSLQQIEAADSPQNRRWLRQIEERRRIVVVSARDGDCSGHGLTGAAAVRPVGRSPSSSRAGAPTNSRGGLPIPVAPPHSP